MEDGKVIGFEELIRWEIRKGDLVKKDVLVEREEEEGKDKKIKIYVMESMIEEMGEKMRKRSDLSINIKIKEREMKRKELMRRMERRIEEDDIEKKKVGLEMKERKEVDF